MYQIEYREQSQIKLNDNNPRFIRDEKFEKLVRSLIEFPEMLHARGIAVADGVTLGGNMRLRALAEVRGYDAKRKQEIVQEQRAKRLEKGHTPEQLDKFAGAMQFLLFEKDIPVIDLTGLPVEKQREFLIKDNVGFGEWDFEQLANEWPEDLDAWGMDLPMGWGEEDDTDEGEPAPMFGPPTLKIEFETELEKIEARALIEEALRGKMEVKIK